MNHLHAMPFGTKLLEDGGARFRLWAPGAGRAALVLEGTAAARARDARPEPMRAVPGGWFELDCPRAGAGSLYRFELDGRMRVPDPAARANPFGVHGPSEVWDPESFAWEDDGWCGRPWEEAVVYELHTGTFSPEGSFAGVAGRLDHLARLGVTALELMPVAACPGTRNWGYDGVLPFTPAPGYGGPDALKRLVAEAHRRGLMVLLDVVYNHFGPDGNYLPAYAPDFFTERHRTPWGPAINFDGPGSETVRAFFIHNALYWLEEFRADGLRLDAVHAMRDDSRPHFLEELAAAVAAGPGRTRRVHLVLENDRNEAFRLRPRQYAAQWNDDFHHAMHVLLTGETAGYYADYGTNPAAHLGRCLTEGFAYQGEPSSFHGGNPRGEPSADLPPTAFVDSLQTHDQVGNRAFGERLDALAPAGAVAMAAAILLLAPAPPLLFMGEEFAAATPFLFFCDFQDDLALAVREGRQREFPEFGPETRGRLPDPNAEATFARSRLDWDCLARAPHRDRLALYQRLLALRRKVIVPRLSGGVDASCARVGQVGLACRWRFGDGTRLTLLANPGPEPTDGFPVPAGRLLVAEPEAAGADHGGDGGAVPGTVGLPPWAAAWFLAEPGGAP